MKFLLYGINYSPELTGIGKYSGEMAAWLSEHGHEVRVVTAQPYYPDWKVFSEYSSLSFKRVKEKGVLVTRCPLYVPGKPTAIKRLLHLLSFSLTSLLGLFSHFRWRPDVVILVVPTLFCAPQSFVFAKLTGAKSILHIQDYEVDALFGLGITNSGMLKRFAYWCERLLLRRFDQISSISKAMLQRAERKGVEPARLCFFPNWSETGRFKIASRSDALLSKMGVNPANKIVLYSGNIGEKQGLEGVIEVANLVKDRPDLIFLIVGEGAGKARLQDLVKQKKLKNVIFAPLVSYEDLPTLLASADCHLVIQKRGAADAVLPSKLTNILAVGGNAVITADPDTSLGRLCIENPGIAQLAEPESQQALLDSIQKTLAMPSHNSIATKYAEEFLDKDRILNRFLESI